MKINPDVIRNLQIDAGTARTERAKYYYEKGKVKIVKATYENDKNFSVRAVVRGSMPYRTYVEIEDGEIQDVTCTCEDYYNHYSVCKHTLASVLALLDWEEEIGEERGSIIRGKIGIEGINKAKMYAKGYETEYKVEETGST